MKFLVNIDRDEDGVWIVQCPAIPGCVSQGDTKDEAIANAQDAIRACLEVRAERGMPIVGLNGGFPVYTALPRNPTITHYCVNV